MTSQSNRLLTPAVIVAALGYFVDIYDLVLFSIVRVPSLRGLGYEGQALFDHGVSLLNHQMIGLLIGGIIWGILGDKRGRLTVLFGSIFMYSVANLANAFVHSIEAYAIWRFIAGVGLAGELGAGITLVAEILPKNRRGLGTTLVAGVGVSGAILAGVIAEFFNWRTCYIIGGTLGLALLFLRIGVRESGMFSNLKATQVARGHFLSLFKKWDLTRRYLACVLVGIPIWYVIGILVTFSPEFALATGSSSAISGGRAILFTYLGLVLGDIGSGLLSQRLQSRKRALYVFVSMTTLFVLAFFLLRDLSEVSFYLLCVCLGTSVGYWAIFVTVAAEQFGTNLRATTATTIPNFVRGSVVPLTLTFTALKPSMGLLSSGAAVGAATLVIAFFAIHNLNETFSHDLDFIE